MVADSIFAHHFLSVCTGTGTTPAVVVHKRHRLHIILPFSLSKVIVIRSTMAKIKFSAALFVSAMMVTADAWSTEGLNRRQIFGLMGAGAAALVAEKANASSARTGASSPFTGFYDDPNHPNCLRQVKVVGAPLRGDGTRSAYPVVEVTGYDGKGNGATCTDRPTVSN